MQDERVAEVEKFLEAEGVPIENKETQEAQQKDQSTERVLTDFEKDQAAKGWNPTGEKSAEEWARAAPLYDELKERGRELKQLRRTVDEMKQHMQKQEKLAYERALADLQSQRNAAIQNGNVNLVNQIDEAQANLVPTSYEAVEEPLAVSDFKERNASWLNGTSYEEMKMAEFALKRDNELAAKKLSPDAHMKVLEEHIKKEFPEYFRTGEERTTSAVESGYGDNVAKPVSKRKATFNDLDSTQKQIARDFERMGVMKVEEYVKQLVDAGEVFK